MTKWWQIKDDPNLSDRAAALRDQAARRLGFEEPNQPGHKAPDVNLSDLPKVPTGPGPGQPIIEHLTPEADPINARINVEIDRVVSELAGRIEKVLALHRKKRISYMVAGEVYADDWCEVDRHAWPCETVKILTGKNDG